MSRSLWADIIATWRTAAAESVSGQSTSSATSHTIRERHEIFTDASIRGSSITLAGLLNPTSNDRAQDAFIFTVQDDWVRRFKLGDNTFALPASYSPPVRLYVGLFALEFWAEVVKGGHVTCYADAQTKSEVAELGRGRARSSRPKEPHVLETAIKTIVDQLSAKYELELEHGYISKAKNKLARRLSQCDTEEKRARLLSRDVRAKVEAADKRIAGMKVKGLVAPGKVAEDPLAYKTFEDVSASTSPTATRPTSAPLRLTISPSSPSRSLYGSFPTAFKASPVILAAVKSNNPSPASSFGASAVKGVSVTPSPNPPQVPSKKIQQPRSSVNVQHAKIATEAPSPSPTTKSSKPSPPQVAFPGKAKASASAPTSPLKAKPAAFGNSASALTAKPAKPGPKATGSKKKASKTVKAGAGGTTSTSGVTWAAHEVQTDVSIKGAFVTIGGVLLSPSGHITEHFVNLTLDTRIPVRIGSTSLAIPSKHIDEWESYGNWFALSFWRERLRSGHVLCSLDNTGAVRVADRRNSFSSKDKTVEAVIARALIGIERQDKLTLRYRHLPRSQNALADRLTHCRTIEDRRNRFDVKMLGKLAASDQMISLMKIPGYVK